MEKYKVLFIDEEIDNHFEFKNYVNTSQRAIQIEVMTLLPLGNLEEMKRKIFKLNPDVLISDFMLNEKRVDINYNVPYDGAELIQSFLNVREGFPCFVLTAFDDKAINESEDVNIVYVKNVMHNFRHDNKAKTTFLDRVVTQAEHYKSKVKSAEKELLGLVKKRERGLTSFQDETRIIELDSFLENVVDRENAIPEEYKNTQNVAKLQELLKKVDVLTNKIRDNNG